MLVLKNSAGTDLAVFDSLGRLGIGVDPTDVYNLNILGSNASGIQIKIENTLAGNTGFLIENSSAAFLNYIDSTGEYRLFGSAPSFRIDHGAPNTALWLKSDGNIIHKGIASQTANMLTLQNSTGTDLAVFDSDGYLNFPPDNPIINFESIRFIHKFQHPTGSTAVPAGQNTFVGEGSGNLSMGSGATGSSHGSYNTGIGYATLDALTNGYANAAIGPDVLTNCTTGYYNMGMGFSALAGLTTSYGNVGIGASSLRFLTSGDKNVAIGNDSGRVHGSGNITSASDSVFIGYLSKANANGESNQIVIGASVTGNGSNTVTIGNASINNTYLRGTLNLADLPTSASGLSAGDVWNDSGTLKIV